MPKYDTKAVKKQVMEAMNFRHATKEYDKNRKIPDEDFEYILEAGRLSPSSMSAEPWKFVVVQNEDLRERMKPYASGAVKKLEAASHFVVILSKRNLLYNSEYIIDQLLNVQMFPEDILERVTESNRKFQENKDLLESSRALDDWASKQTYIALGNMLTAAAMIGVDSTPMEGFDTEKINEIFAEEGLLEDDGYTVSAFAAFGYRKEDPKRPKRRRPMDAVVTWVN